MFDRVERRILENSIPIPESGCLVWLGAVQRADYGVIRNEVKSLEPVHRLAYRIFHKLTELPSNIFICHKCDVPSCCNPLHLFAGTQFDNLADMTKKGRRKAPKHFGESNGRAKVTNEQRSEICASTASNYDLSKYYNLSLSQICRIKQRGF